MSNSAYSHLFTEDLYRPASGVVIVLAKPWESYSADDKTLLSKIVGSVRLTLASVQIISTPVLSWNSLASYTPSRVLVFGSETEGVKSYELAQAHGFSVVKVDDLSQLDDARKKSLWQALKNQFSV